jgi:hypothetical protein
MKATTQFQLALVEANKKIQPFNQEQERFLVSILPKIGFVTKSGKFNCLECGNSTKNESNVCTICNNRLSLEKTQKRKYYNSDYAQIIEVVDQYQVIRNIFVETTKKIGFAATYSLTEVSRVFLNEKGKHEVFSRLIHNNFYSVRDCWQGQIELRDRSTISKHNFRTFVYPKIKTIEAIKKNGFKTLLRSIAPITLFKAILTNTKAETLLKTKEYKFLQFFYFDFKGNLNFEKINDNWQSILIAKRANYKIEDINLWFDMLYTLKNLNKDIRNKFYICPVNLKEAHDYYLKKLRIKETEERNKRLIESISSMEPEYKKKIKQYSTICIENEKKDIKITVLGHVRDFKKIEDDTKLCLFSNKFFKKKQSLIFKATADDQLLEVIELNLNNLSIEQIHSKNHKKSKRRGEIRKLFTSQIRNEIRQLENAK